MNVWKIGSRCGQYSLLETFKRNNIVFVGQTEEKYYENINNVKPSDLVAVGNGFTIVAVGIVLSFPDYITKFEIEFDDDDPNVEDYKELATGFKVLLYFLDESDYITYKNRTAFNQVHGEHEIGIENKYNELFLRINNISGERNSFAIRELGLNNYLGLKKVHIANIPINTQWIFLTGENGFGKTSILKSITICLNGKNDGDRFVVQNNELNGSFVIIKTENQYRMNIIDDERFVKFENFAAYGAFRTKLLPTLDTGGKLDNLFEKSDSVLNFEFRFTKMEGFDEQKKQRSIIVNILKELIPNLDKIEIVEDLKEGSKVIYYEKTNEGELLPPVEFGQLAMGMRSIIGFVCDMYFRLSSYQSNTKDIEGIVLIDEFDNHLHPKWQRMLVEKLTKLFPKVQFIVSTHSPIPFLGAPKNSVFIKVDRNKKDGITAEIIDIDISTLSPNSILTSPVFGFDALTPNMHEGNKITFAGDDYNKKIDNERIEKEFGAYLTKDKMNEFMKILNH